MTAKSDAMLERLETILAQLEAVGAPVAPAPTSVYPDGSPGPVAPGELIESAWGNAVVNEFRRQRAWPAQTLAPFGPVGVGTADVTGLQRTVTLHPERLYRATTFIPAIDPTLDGICSIQLVNSVSEVLNSGHHFHEDGGRFSLFTSVTIGGQSGDMTIWTRLWNSAGTLTVPGDGANKSFLLIEEISGTWA